MGFLDRLKSAFGGIGNGIKSAFGSVSGTVKDVVNTVYSDVKSGVSFIGNSYQNTANKLIDSGTKVVVGAEQTVSGVSKDIMGTVFNCMAISCGGRIGWNFSH